MANIIINEKNKVLEINKAFARAAACFGSDEYNELKEARRDFPIFKVVIKSTSRKSKNSFSGLTYDFMEKYISAHDNSDINLNEYKSKREIGKSVVSAKAYKEIKVWFLEKYPEVAKFAE